MDLKATVVFFSVRSGVNAPLHISLDCGMTAGSEELKKKDLRPSKYWLFVFSFSFSLQVMEYKALWQVQDSGE